MTTTMRTAYRWCDRNQIGEPLPVVRYNTFRYDERPPAATIQEAGIEERKRLGWRAFAVLVVKAVLVGLCFIPFVFPMEN
jgi:hypothetical protein